MRPIEQHFACRDFPVDQPQGDGVASFSRSRRVRSQPPRQRRPRRPHGEKLWLSFPLMRHKTSLNGPGLNTCSPVQVLEPRFNVETMALLLNIPPNKTLLRRHLATHFSLLIGSEAQQLKQECLENPDYILLTATTKVKVICFVQFWVIIIRAYFFFSSGINLNYFCFSPAKETVIW